MKNKTICDYCKEEIKLDEVHYYDVECDKSGKFINKSWHIMCRRQTNKFIHEAICDRLKVLRYERNLTEGEFEKRLNLPEDSVYKCENEGLRLDDEILVKIALAHGVSLDWLFGLTENRHNTNKGE